MTPKLRQAAYGLLSAALLTYYACGNAQVRDFPGQVIPATEYGEFSAAKVDHAAVIQRAIDAAAATGGGRVVLPRGEYWLAAGRSGPALIVPARVFLDLNGATLHLMATELPSYQVVLLTGRGGPSGVGGGVIIGDREAHLGTGGEWGMCVSVRGAHDVTISNLITKDCWGDGIYVGSSLTSERSPSANVQISDVVAEHNRRNNISIVSADGFSLTRVQVKRAAGVKPEAGIDLEPNRGDVVRNGRLSSILSEGNGSYGIVFGGSKSEISWITLESINARGNGGAGFWLQFSSHISASGLTAEANKGEGLVLWRTRAVDLSNYSGKDNTKEGVSVRNSEAVRLDRVRVNGRLVDRESHGVEVRHSSDVTIQ